MKGLKKKVSWLLIASMVMGQASFASLADSDEEDYQDEIVLINDLFGGSSGKSRGKSRSYAKEAALKEVTWTDAEPKVTWEAEGDKVGYYANGEAVTVVASASNTYIVEESGAYTEVDSTKTTYLYGGATASNACESTDITVQGGEIDQIIGGNRFEGSLDKVNITIHDGTVGIIYANASSSAKGKLGNISGASSFADRKTRSVGNVNITMNGGSVTGLLSGTGGYSHIGNLQIEINGGKIDTGDNWSGVFAGGANGEVKNAKVIMNGGDVNLISNGQRALVGSAVYELNAGKVGDIYAGTSYPETEKADGYTSGKAYGNFHYGKADKLEIKLGEDMTYGGLYAGFHLLDSEKGKALPWLGQHNTFKAITEEYYTDAGKPDVTVSVAAAPTGAGSDFWLEGNDLILNAFDTGKEYDSYVDVTFPKLKVEDGTITVAEDAVATGSNTVMNILPGTEVTVTAKAPSADRKFTAWEMNETLGEADQEELTFKMPTGMDDVILKALYADKSIKLDVTSLELDLDSAKGSMNGEIHVEASDFDTPVTAEGYDREIIEVVTDDSETFEVKSCKEGKTTIQFRTEGTDKILAEVSVTVIDTTPTLNVTGGVITAIGSDSGLEETSARIEEGTSVTVKADGLPDKIFTGWSGAAVAEDGTFTMPVQNVTIEAQYRDKVFAFAEDTAEELILNADQSETNTEKLPKSASFRMVSDYADYKVTSGNEAVVTVSETGDGVYTVTAEGAGLCKVHASAVKDSGETITISLNVTVKDTTKEMEAVSGKAEVDTEDAVLPDADRLVAEQGVPAEKAEEVAEAIDAVSDAAKDTIAANAAVANGATTGFDRAENLKEQGVPEGVKVEIYPRQTLEEIQVALETSTRTVKDEVTGEEILVTDYKPVISKVVYEIAPYLKAAGVPASPEDKPLKSLRGRFTFRIPVPSGISAAARYAKVNHEGDAVATYAPIREEGGAKFITVTTTHFSRFELEFVAERPYSGGSGGSGGGSGSSPASAGTWILDQIGWWYQNGDKSYPVNRWAQLPYGTLGMKWYHFDSVGYMQTGWFTDVDGHRYYLHTVSDGSMGHMYIGWHEIDGRWYYFTETKTEKNPVGSLLVNTTTPDGAMVGADGARIQ